MAKSYLDKDGLLYFWQKIKNVFVTDVTYDSTNKKIQKTKAGSTSDVVTLSTVATSGSYNDLSNKPTIPTLKNVFGKVKVGSTTVEADTTQDTLEFAAGDGISLTPDATNDKVTIAGTLATSSAPGMLSSSDFTKLSGIATGAEVNQNAFSNVKVGSTTVAADSKTDTLELVAGTNIALTPDATNDKVTIATSAEVNQNAFSNVKVGSTTVAADAKTDTLELAAGDGISLTPDDTNDKVTITGTLATSSAPGMLSSSDFTKLSGIATGAEVNQNAFSNVKVGSTTVAADSKTDTLELAAGTNVTLTPDATNDKVTIATSAEVNQNAFSNVKVGSTTVAADTKTDTLELVGGTNIALTPDATNDKVTIASAHYGECSTSAATAAKTVSCTGYTLNTGSVIYVKFTITNTAAVADLTLNVNSTGAKAIKYRGGNVTSAGTLSANRTYAFVYDGTNYQLVGDLDTNTTYTNASLGQGYGSCDTAAGTAAKTVSISNYALVTGGIVSVKFVNGNTASNPTLNVNSKGAGLISYRGAGIGSDLIKAGDIVTFMCLIDSSSSRSYLILAIDRKPVEVEEMVPATSSADGEAGYVPTPPAYTARHSTSASSEEPPISAAEGYSMLTSGGWGSLEVGVVAYRPEEEGSEAVSGLVVCVVDSNNHHLVEAGIQGCDLVDALLKNEAYGVVQLNANTKIDSIYLPTATSSAYGAVKVGTANGVCPLNANTKIDATYLPSYVDDVIEVYARSGQTALSQNWFATGSASGTVVTPEAGKIYVLMADSGDYAANTQFRWGGSAYVKMADGGVSSITNAEIDTIMAA